MRTDCCKHEGPNVDVMMVDQLLTRVLLKEVMPIAQVNNSLLWNPLLAPVLSQMNQVHAVFPEYSIYS